MSERSHPFPPRDPPSGSIATAFGLQAAGDLVPHGAEINDTWLLDTRDGRVFVKRVRWDEPDWWRSAAEKAMSFEDAARSMGLPIPRPLVPVDPYFGYISRIDGGLFRAYEWIDGRALQPDEDLSEWLGELLARLHQVRAGGEPDRWIYGLRPIEEWASWLEEGRAKNVVWADALEARLGDIDEAMGWISAALDGAGEHVTTHRDVEPHNVLITRSGPVLVDFEGAGSDSASLEAAHACLVFALTGGVPDEGRIRRTMTAYCDAGGRSTMRGRAALARRVGMRLNRLTWNLFISLGHRVVTPGRTAGVAAHARDQLDNLPKLIADVTVWSEMFS